VSRIDRQVQMCKLGDEFCVLAPKDNTNANPTHPDHRAGAAALVAGGERGDKVGRGLAVDSNPKVWKQPAKVSLFFCPP